MTRIKKPLALFLGAQGVASVLLLLSNDAYANFAVAMTSSMLIVIGSLYSYRNMIAQRVEETDIEDSKDIIDTMDDPYDLYEEERLEEITDIKAMIKAEKARQKSNMIQNTTKNASAWVSLYRLIPYAFLILGFIALQKNHALSVLPYLVGLTAGIAIGYLIAKGLFISQSSER